MPIISARTGATIGVVVVAAILGLTSYAVVSRRSTDQFAACRSGNVAGGQIGGPLQLVDETGQTVTEAQIISKPALVYFGFASCADVCPLDNARNVEAADLLAKAGYDVTPVFITVDPSRDSPSAMASYTDNFSERLLGYTGSAEQIKAATTAYKVMAQLPQDPSGDYQVSHTTLTYLVLPQVGFVDFFHRETPAQVIVDHTGCFLKAS